MRVKAIEPGYYGLLRRKPEDEFKLKSEKEFSKRWMEFLESKPTEAKPSLKAKLSLSKESKGEE